MQLVDEVLASALERVSVLKMTVGAMVLEELKMLTLCMHNRSCPLPDHVKTHEFTCSVCEDTASETELLLTDGEWSWFTLQSPGPLPRGAMHRDIEFTFERNLGRK